MSNRLTTAAKANTPIWNIVAFFWLAAFTAALVLLHVPAEPPVIPDEAHALYRSLPSPMWTGHVQALSLVLIFLASGGLLRFLTPEKASADVRAAALVFGGAGSAFLLNGFIPRALGPQPLYPAWALSLIGALALFSVKKPLHRPLLGIGGLLSGLALSLDTGALPAVLPALAWLLLKIPRAPKTGGLDALLWGLGLAVGLAPVFLGFTPFVMGLVPSQGLPGLEKLPSPLLQTFTWWSVPFALLALLAAVLQLRLVCLGWMLPVALLQLLWAANRQDPLPDTLFFVCLPAAWLVSYGAFRLVKGVEQGVRGLNPKKAKPVLPLATGALLLACSAWGAFQFL